MSYGFCQQNEKTKTHTAACSLPCLRKYTTVFEPLAMKHRTMLSFLVLGFLTILAPVLSTSLPFRRDTESAGQEHEVPATSNSPTPATTGATTCSSSPALLSYHPKNVCCSVRMVGGWWVVTTDLCSPWTETIFVQLKVWAVPTIKWSVPSNKEIQWIVLLFYFIPLMLLLCAVRYKACCYEYLHFHKWSLRAGMFMIKFGIVLCEVCYKAQTFLLHAITPVPAPHPSPSPSPSPLERYELYLLTSPHCRSANTATNAVAHMAHCNILDRYECAREKSLTFWEKLQVCLNLTIRFLITDTIQQTQTPRFLLGMFPEFPFLLNQFSMLHWDVTLNRGKLVRQMLYAHMKRLKAKERKAKSELLRSTRFNAFTYIVFRAKGINLDCTRTRVLEYLKY